MATKLSRFLETPSPDSASTAKRGKPVGSAQNESLAAPEDLCARCGPEHRSFAPGPAGTQRRSTEKDRFGREIPSKHCQAVRTSI